MGSVKEAVIAEQPKQHSPLVATTNKLAAAIMLAALGLNVHADVVDLPGLSNVEKAAAQTIDQLVVNMNNYQQSGNTLSRNESLLLQRCEALVTAANDVVGGDSVFTPNDILNVVHAIIPDEVGVVSSGFTDTAQSQVSVLTSRLSQMRISSGMPSVSALTPEFGTISGGMASADGFSRLSMFANISAGSGDKDATREEVGFDFDNQSLTVGVDYKFSQDLIGGVALAYLQSESDIDKDGGNYDSDGIALSMYGTYYKDNYYFDAVINYGQSDYDSKRKVTYVDNLNPSQLLTYAINGDTEGDQLSLSLGGGYNFYANEWSYIAFTRLDYVTADIDAYDENDFYDYAMSIGKMEVDSLQLVIGGQAAYTVSTGMGVFVPYIGAELHKEFKDDEIDIEASYLFDPTATKLAFATDPADETYGTISLGSNLVLQGGWQVFLNIDSVVGLDDVSNNQITLGGRMEF